MSDTASKEQGPEHNEIRVLINICGRVYRGAAFIPASKRLTTQGIIQHHFNEMMKSIEEDIKKDFPK